MMIRALFLALSCACATALSPLVVANDDSDCALYLTGPGRSSAYDYSINLLKGNFGYDGQQTCITYDAVNQAYLEARNRILVSQPKGDWKPEDYASVGELVLDISINLARRYGLTYEEVEKGLPLIDTSRTLIREVCPPVFSHVECRAGKYRRFDGLCNNLHHPTWGATNSPFQRLIGPLFSDGINAPRISHTGHDLPLSRVVSRTMHPDDGFHDHAGTVMVIAWGQFMDHDYTLTGTPLDPLNRNDPEECCKRPPHLKHPYCNEIRIPDDDYFYRLFGVKCIDFVRAFPSPRPGCRLGSRVAFNTLTGVIDGNTVYGVTEKFARKLRTGFGGLLRMNPVFKDYGLKDLLPLKLDIPDEGCTRPNKNMYCFEAGEIRVNEQLVLTVMHTLMAREHNRVAKGLADVNPHWDDETLFQEARRINIAEIQHITFNEFLPILLGKDVMEKFGLVLEKEGYWDGYDTEVNPDVIASFAAAAYRFGHSLLPTAVERWSKAHKFIASKRLSDLIRRPYDLYRAGVFDEYVMGLMNQVAQAMDDSITQEVTNHLFKKVGARFGMDLVSFNMQRGREFGIPGYMEFRKFCGLPGADSFQDLFGSMSNHTVRKYETIFEHPIDVDLWSGGVSERPLPGSMLGPTFACIIATQFSYSRRGDRFWFELPNQPSSFTPAQLAEIRKSRLARVICDNTDIIDTVQLYPMVLPDHELNPRVPCRSGIIPGMDFSKWADPTPFRGPAKHFVTQASIFIRNETEQNNNETNGINILDKQFDAEINNNSSDYRDTTEQKIEVQLQNCTNITGQNTDVNTQNCKDMTEQKTVAQIQNSNAVTRQKTDVHVENSNDTTLLNTDVQMQNSNDATVQNTNVQIKKSNDTTGQNTDVEMTHFDDTTQQNNNVSVQNCKDMIGKLTDVAVQNCNITEGEVRIEGANIITTENNITLQDCFHDDCKGNKKNEIPNSETVFKYVYKKGDKIKDDQKSTGHEKNSLKRRKRSALSGIHDELLDPEQKTPLIVNYETSHGSGHGGSSPIRNNKNNIKSSALADFSIETLHANTKRGNLRGKPSPRGNYRHGVGEHRNIHQNNRPSKGSEETSREYGGSSKDSDERIQNKALYTNSNPSSDSNDDNSAESLENSGEKKHLAKHRYTDDAVESEESAEETDSNDKTSRYSKSREQSEESNERNHSNENLKSNDKTQYSNRDHSNDDYKSNPRASIENSNENSDGILGRKSNTRDNYRKGNRNSPIQDDFSYERIQVNEKGEVEAARDNHQNISSEPIIIQTTIKPTGDLKSYNEKQAASGESGESSSSVEKDESREPVNISDGESKPVVEASDGGNIELSEKNTEESPNNGASKENNSFESENNDSKIKEGDVKQEYERIPSNYNHNNKHQSEGHPNIKSDGVESKNTNPSNRDGTLDVFTPKDDNFDEHLKIKFADVTVKLPEIQLPEDILAYARAEPTYTYGPKNYDKNPTYYNYYKNDDNDEKQKQSEKQKQKDSDDTDDEPAYYGYYNDGKEKQAYKKEDQSEEKEEDEEEEDADLYEKFVRERFGKQGSFQKRSEQLQDNNSKPQNPQLYETVKNILKKTEQVHQEAEKSGDPKAGYMWTLEYGENL